MAKVIRFDSGTLRKPERTPQGFLKVDGLAARCGVLEYRNPDGSIRKELRLPEEVARADSLAAFEGISVTDGHPTVLVDTDNVRTLEAGTVTGAARMDGDWVVAPMVVKDKKLIAKIEAGDTGLSVGYKIRLDATPGRHPVYGEYHAIQRDIMPNHIAGAVKIPRAGDGARIRMDGVETDALYAVEESASRQQIDRPDARSDSGHQKGNPMDKDEQIRLLNQQLSEAKGKLAEAEGNLKVRTDERDALSGQLAVAKQKQEETQTRLDSGLAVAETEKVKEMQTRLDTANTEIATLKSSIPGLVKKRGALVSKARAVMGEDYRADAIDDRAIQEACIRRLDPKAELKDQSDAHIEARFDALYEARAASATSLKRASHEMSVVRTDTVQEPDPFDPLHNGVGVYASPHARQKGA